MKYALVLPCYNEEANLKKLLPQWKSLAPENFRLVIVDNGSTDGTQAYLNALSQAPAFSFLHVVTVSPNAGYGYGVWEGLKAALTFRPAYLGFMHADGQCAPENALRAFHVLETQPRPSLVSGRRTHRTLASVLFSRSFELAVLFFWREGFFEINAQPKVFPLELLLSLVRQDLPPKDFSFDLYLLRRAKQLGFKIVRFPVRWEPREQGESRWATSFSSRLKTISRVLHYLKTA